MNEAPKHHANVKRPPKGARAGLGRPGARPVTQNGPGSAFRPTQQAAITAFIGTLNTPGT
jgi:hypothetical protein